MEIIKTVGSFITVENIGYLTIYLFLGWIVSPIYKSMHRNFGEKIMNISKNLFIITWFACIPITLFLIWADGISPLAEQDNE